LKPKPPKIEVPLGIPTNRPLVYRWCVSSNFLMGSRLTRVWWGMPSDPPYCYILTKSYQFMLYLNKIISYSPIPQIIDFHQTNLVKNCNKSLSNYVLLFIHGKSSKWRLVWLESKKFKEHSSYSTLRFMRALNFRIGYLSSEKPPTVYQGWGKDRSTCHTTMKVLASNFLKKIFLCKFIC